MIEREPPGLKDAINKGRKNETVEFQEWCFVYEIMMYYDPKATWYDFIHSLLEGYYRYILLLCQA